MKLVNEQFDFVFDFDNNNINSLVCENQRTFYDFVKTFLESNDDEKFVLSHNDKIIDLKESSDVILSPFSYDLNNKKFLDKLLSKIRDNIFNTELYQDYLELNKKLIDFFNKISLNCDFEIEHNIDTDPKSIIKYMNIRLSYKSEDPIENLLTYMEYSKKLLETKIFVFINLKQYFIERDIFTLCKHIEYNKYNALFLDNKEYEKYQDEFVYIIDKDNCGIY